MGIILGKPPGKARVSSRVVLEESAAVVMSFMDVGSGKMRKPGGNYQ